MLFTFLFFFSTWFHARAADIPVSVMRFMREGINKKCFMIITIVMPN